LLTPRNAPRIGRRRLFTTLAAASVAASLGACGEKADAPAAPVNPIAEGVLPDYYPAEYNRLVDAAKGEGGTLTIYSNIDEDNWGPVFRDFRKKYPWVTKITNNDLDSEEVFERALSEQGAGASPADVLVSSAAQAWAEYNVEGQGRLAPYVSPELGRLPKFATLMPNVYAMSMDPMVIAYNSELVKEVITGLGSLATVVVSDRRKFAGKITTRDVTGAFGFTVSNAFVQANPEHWTRLVKVLPLARSESSSGTQTKNLVSGDFLVGFFISAAPSYPVVKESGGKFQITFLDDGTVVLPRGLGITPQAPHLNTAKLFTDFVLSKEGQRAVAEGGLTSYRADVPRVEGLHTYQEVVEQVGEDMVIPVKYQLVPDADVQQFVTRWNGLLAR
jgi:iron(III) transport system substrate-binding protein